MPEPGLSPSAAPAAGPGPAFSREEMMTVAAARMLTSGTVCFVGIGPPSTAANLARLTHAPDVVLVYESGTIAAKPRVLPLSIGDGELAETADTVVSVPEMFAYWVQGGRIDVAFLGAGQIDRFANINTTVIGDYAHPKVRLPGAGGAPEVAAAAREVLVIVRHERRVFVERLDFRTTVGFLDGGASRARAGLRGGGPSAVITDLGILRPDPETRELVLTRLHPGVGLADVKAATGWALRAAPDLAETPAPEAHELEALRALKEGSTAARTRDAAPAA